MQRNDSAQGRTRIDSYQLLLRQSALPVCVLGQDYSTTFTNSYESTSNVSGLSMNEYDVL